MELVALEESIIPPPLVILKSEHTVPGVRLHI